MNDLKQINQILQNHARRILTLEKGLARKTLNKAIKDFGVASTDYSGPTGGVRYLISMEFFKEKRDLASVREQLSREDYHYSRQAIHEALKVLSKSTGPLVALKEGKRKSYVERK